MMAEKSDLAIGPKEGRFQIATVDQSCPPEKGEGSLDKQDAEPLVRVAGQEGDGVVSPEETVETIVAELFQRIDFGRLGQLQRKLKVNKNFFRGWKDHPDRARLLPLVQALAYLEIEPADFFAAVFTPEHSPLIEPSPPEPPDELENFFAPNMPIDTPLPRGVPPIGVQNALRNARTFS